MVAVCHGRPQHVLYARRESDDNRFIIDKTSAAPRATLVATENDKLRIRVAAALPSRRRRMKREKKTNRNLRAGTTLRAFAESRKSDA